MYDCMILGEHSVAPAAAAAATASGSVTGVLCGSCSSSNSVRERHRSVLSLLQQQQERLGASQEFSVALAAAETESGSLTGAFCGSCSSNSVCERHRSVLWLLQQQP